jgi:hypothetical protein
MLLLAILTRPAVSKLAAGVFLAAQLPGWVACARAGDAAPASLPAAPPVNPRVAIRRALREFDQFLDRHPSLEEQLRRDPPLAASATFLARNPEFADFLRANPNVPGGLKIYPRYFLNRALRRQASAPVSFGELAPFKDLFQAAPGLERELTETPEAIRNPGFVAAHPALREMLAAHPDLARVFQPAPSAPVAQ